MVIRNSTRQLIRSDIKDTEHVQFVQGDIARFTNQLKQQDGRNIWIVGGGELLSSFIEEQLIDEMILTIAPVVIGNGIPLFKEGHNQTEFTLKRTRTFNQFVELHYEVKA